MPIFKNIQTIQKTITNDVLPFSGNGYHAISGTNLTFTRIQRDPSNGRQFSNMYSSFKLPVTNMSGTTWPNIPTDSYFSGLNQSDALVINIGKNTYGELIDGRSIHLILPTAHTTNGTYQMIDIYSSYINPANWSSDNHAYAAGFGHSVNPGTADVGKPSTNVAFLFSDKATNNGGTFTLPVDSCCTSWSAGYPTEWDNAGSTTPSDSPVGYTDGNTKFYNMDVNNSNRKPQVTLGSGGDKPIGIAYLDKGFCVITDPDIVKWFYYSGTSSGATGYPYGSQAGGTGAATAMTETTFTASTSARCEFFTFEKEWVLSVECTANDGEFYSTENVTASPEIANGAGGALTVANGVYSLTGGSQDYSAYITEVGLFDSQDNLLAIAKPDRPVAKPANSTQIFTLKFKY